MSEPTEICHFGRQGGGEQSANVTAFSGTGLAHSAQVAHAQASIRPSIHPSALAVKQRYYRERCYRCGDESVKVAEVKSAAAEWRQRESSHFWMAAAATTLELSYVIAPLGGKKGHENLAVQ